MILYHPDKPIFFTVRYEHGNHDKQSRLLCMKLSIFFSSKIHQSPSHHYINVIYENIYFSALRFISQHRSLSAKSENSNCFIHDGPEEPKQRHFQLATALGLQVSAHGSGCSMYNFFYTKQV